MEQADRLWFGINLDPKPELLELSFELVQYADQHGLQLISVQDHPYNPSHVETWTMLAALGARSSQVRLLPNVLNLPLRPPALLAKAAATLDLLTGGRLELGLGAGGIWDAIAGYGGPRRSASESVDALEEAIKLIRLLWSGNDGAPVSFAGQHYQLEQVRPGPLPARPIGIWLGALKPRMLNLTGRLADGWSISYNWSPPEQVPEQRAVLEAAAQQAGRPMQAIRRNYNLMGIIDTGTQPNVRVRQGMIAGSVANWAELIARCVDQLGMDSFIYWPVAGDLRIQLRLWSEEVVPAARRLVG